MKNSAFTRIFGYTILLLLLMCLASAVIFARQFFSFYREEETRRIAGTFEPVLGELTGKDPEELAEKARAFYEKNQSLTFLIRDAAGNTLFATPGAEARAETESDPGPRIVVRLFRLSGEEYHFLGYGENAGKPHGGLNRRELVWRAALAFAVMIVIAVSGAVFFAWKITRPLEKELARERIMEENQRLFFSAASHELKTPIAAARALVEGMIANAGDFRNHGKYLRECLKTLDTQGRLVSEILEIVKLSEEKPDFETVDAAALINSLLDGYRPLAERRNLAVDAPLAACPVRTGRQLLTRALSNIIANAVQNTPEGGTVHISAERYGVSPAYIRIAVVNTGAHIAEELLPHLFEPFYRLDPARSRAAKGPVPPDRDIPGEAYARSGLGLAIVKKTLDRLGVPFALENTADGVSFRLDLPVSV